jgi:hypothetical protein
VKPPEIVAPPEDSSQQIRPYDGPSPVVVRRAGKPPEIVAPGEDSSQQIRPYDGPSPFVVRRAAKPPAWHA